MKNEFTAPQLSVADLSKSLYEVSMKLQKANEDLQEKEQESAKFYANISHDLRAPITAISNSIEYLQTNKDIARDDLEETLNMMSGRISYLTRLINDIFLLASLDTPSVSVHKELVSVRFFLEDFFYMAQADTVYDDCDLSLDLDELFLEKNPMVEMDPQLMRRALENLFSNAKKYSLGRPQITLGATILEDGRLAVFVKDKGIGISSDKLDRIFERAYRIDNSRTPGGDNGSGFGLSIVKSIVELHDGIVTCKSFPEKGSTFFAIFNIEN